MTRLHVLLILALPLATLPAMACGMEVEDDSMSLASLMEDIEAVAVAVVTPLAEAAQPTEASAVVEAEAQQQHLEGTPLNQAQPLLVGSVEVASLRPVAPGS